MAHTPGKWVAFIRHSGQWTIEAYQTTDHSTLGTIIGYARTLDDARLIAAAPELLAACRKVSEAYYEGGGVYIPEDEVRAAIEIALQKAIGQL